MNAEWCCFLLHLYFFSDPENKTPDHSPSSAWFCVSHAASHTQIHNKNKAGHTRVWHTAMFSACQRFDFNLCWAASQFLMGQAMTDVCVYIYFWFGSKERCWKRPSFSLAYAYIPWTPWVPVIMCYCSFQEENK